MASKTFEVRYFEREEDGSLFTSDIVEITNVDEKTATGVFLARVCDELEFDAADHDGHELRVTTAEGVDILSVATVGAIESSDLRLKAYAGIPHDLETRLKSAERRSSILKSSPLSVLAQKEGIVGEEGAGGGKVSRDLDEALSEAALSLADASSQSDNRGKGACTPSPERAGGLESPRQDEHVASSSSTSPTSQPSSSSSGMVSPSRTKEQISASDLISSAVILVTTLLILPWDWMWSLVGLVVGPAQWLLR